MEKVRGFQKNIYFCFTVYNVYLHVFFLLQYAARHEKFLSRTWASGEDDVRDQDPWFFHICILLHSTAPQSIRN